MFRGWVKLVSNQLETKYKHTMSGTEELGFNRAVFPFVLNEHHLILLQNDLYIVTDGDSNRLKIRLTVSCSLCHQSHTIRGRLPPEYTEYNYYAALTKIAALSEFTQVSCT